MYEENVEELVEDIIKVFITAKDGVKKPNTKFTKKPKVPKILVTDCSDYDIKYLFEETSAEEPPASFRSETDVSKDYLQTGNEFEAEPTELMPETFLSYLSSCKNLIGDIATYSEERLSADQWIQQFDRNRHASDG